MGNVNLIDIDKEKMSFSSAVILFLAPYHLVILSVSGVEPVGRRTASVSILLLIYY